MDQRSQHQTRFTDSDKESVNSLECIGTGDDFMNTTPIAIPPEQQLAINK